MESPHLTEFVLREITYRILGDRTMVASRYFETVGILDFLLSWSRHQPHRSDMIRIFLALTNSICNNFGFN